jgi:uncharacterized membrane protein YbhN (UPF0104 family)
MSVRKSPARGRSQYSRLIRRRNLLWMCVSGIVIYLIAAGLSGLRLSLDAIGAADPALLLAAAVCIALSYGTAATTYVLLATKKISFVPTLLVEVSGGLVNRLLPGGLGGLGINAVYLKRRGYSLPAAVAMVTTNNVIGFAGNILLLALVGLFMPVHARLPELPAFSWWWLAGLAVLATAAVLLFRRRAFAAGARRSAGEMRAYLGVLVRRPGRSLLALLSSCGLTSLHATGLFLVLQAVDSPAAWGIALVAVSAGAFAGAAVPTPGGLGGAEAGIAAALIAFSVNSPEAVAAALVYRGLTYWLPLAPGYLALRVVERKYL